MAKKAAYQSPIVHSWVAKGARLERRALRDAIRRELKAVGWKGGAREEPGLRWVLDWLSGRIDRTRKPSGVGRK